MPPGRKEYVHRWVEREEREEYLCPSEACPTSGPPGPPCSMAERSVEPVRRERRLRLNQPPPGPPLTIPSLTLVRKSPALPQINARWSADHCTHKGSMLAPQSLNPNNCGWGKPRSALWMIEGEPKAPPKDTTPCCFVLLVVFCCDPYILTCDRPLQGRDKGDQQSAQGGSLHTPTTDHSTQLITASP